MNDIVDEFKSESLVLVRQMTALLESIEGDFSKRAGLEQFGQIVDRIMGGAKSIALTLDPKSQMHDIGSYAEICKVIGYKGSQLSGNPEFFNVVLAFLLDAVEMLEEMISSLGTAQELNVKESLKGQLLDRLLWISSRFDSNLRATVALEKKDSAMARPEGKGIDLLLKELGLAGK